MLLLISLYWILENKIQILPDVVWFNAAPVLLMNSEISKLFKMF